MSDLTRAELRSLRQEAKDKANSGQLWASVPLSTLSRLVEMASRASTETP